MAKVTAVGDACHSLEGDHFKVMSFTGANFKVVSLASVIS